MVNSDFSVDVSFRFINLDKFQAYSLEREILGASFQQHTSHDCYVALVPLSLQTFDDINNFYVRQRVELSDCDVLINVCSHAHEGVIAAPAIVNRMLKYIDCKLTFSFSVT